MTPAALLDALEARGVTLTETERGLTARPNAALTDELRAAIRTHRAELLAWVRARDAEFVAEVLEVFAGCDVTTEVDRAERTEDHRPLNVPYPCWNPHTGDRALYCRDWTEEQLWGFAGEGRLAEACRRQKRGCGDCTLVLGRMKLRKLEDENRDRQETQRRRARANWAARGARRTGLE